MTTRTHHDRTQRERKARHAIAWGAGILVVGFVVGAIAALLPAFSGWRLDPAFGLDWLVVVGSLVVSLTGLGFIGYGFVQLARSRPPKEELRREREDRRIGTWTRPNESGQH